MNRWQVAFLEDDYEYGQVKKIVHRADDGWMTMHPAQVGRRPRFPSAYRSLPEAIRHAMIFQHGSPDLTVFVEHATTGARIPVRRWVESEMR